MLAMLISPSLLQDQLSLVVSSLVAAYLSPSEVPMVLMPWQLSSQLYQLGEFLPCLEVVLVLVQQVVEV